MEAGQSGHGGTLLELRLKPREEAAAEAREAIRERLAASVAAEGLDDLLTVVSELVTNSVRYGPGAPIDLRLEMAGDGILRGEVADQGEGEVAIRQIAKPGAGGLGLRLVDTITERWGVYDGSTHVWFELRVPLEAADPLSSRG